MKEENTSFEKFNRWLRQSVTLKLITIGILALVLLIPAAMIISIIHEREHLKNEASREVSSKWAEDQYINGPILTVPILYEKLEDDKLIRTTTYYHILPDQLKIDGELSPKTLKRGIYEVVVYTSDIRIEGSFMIKVEPDPLDLVAIQWDQAFLTIGISDLRGIKDEIEFNWGDVKLSIEPGSRISGIIRSGISVDLLNLQKMNEGVVDFDFKLNLQGSNNMSFVPLGKTTEVDLRSNWDAPSFQGNFLPDEREVSGDGFTARWKILQLNRNFPQAWSGNKYGEDMYASAFGVDLISPLDDYQKSMRSAKYAIMNIALTFLIFFLVEILQKRKIHPLQYTLVGLALCLFYILLISITEHSNFNLAYIISSIAVLLMIGLYSLSIFKSVRYSLVLGFILAAVYGFLFITLQLTDYALLIGSIGLTVILALTMYFTRNINWYELKMKTE